MSTEKLDFKKALVAATKAAELGQEILVEYFGKLKRVSNKFQAGLVSEADVESERAIAKYLKSKFPNIPIMGEEESYLNQAQSLELQKQKCIWLVDPLDGTTNYIHELPFYCVSIGLLWENELVVGVVNLPGMNTVYKASKGYGAYKNNEKMKVSSRRNLHSALLATGFSAQKDKKKQLKVFGSLINEVRGIRRIGSAAFDLCLVAEGVYDGYWEVGLSPWDTAAGAIIVKEAGGIVSDFSSGRFSPFDKSIIAGNRPLHKILKRTIQKHY